MSKALDTIRTQPGQAPQGGFTMTKNWYEAILFGIIILCSIAAGAIFMEVRLELHSLHKEVPTLINGEF